MKRKYILEALNINISIISSLILVIGIITIKFLTPIKTIFIIFLLISIVSFTIFAYLSKKKNLYNTGAFLSFLLNIIIIYNIISLNNQYNYIENLITKEYKYSTYNIYVQKKTPTYNNINKLNGKKIGMLKNNNQNVKEYLNNKVEINYKIYDSLPEIINALEQGEIQSFIIDESTYNNQNVESNYKNKTRIISSDQIKNTKWDTISNFSIFLYIHLPTYQLLKHKYRWFYFGKLHML